ncbi:MerR family transcriptional regulator [Mycolicibacter heraklionensis]|uniref:MerR family transcriptional regulator n=2 Tax=Mycolicibacter heraklionensis TaxID=512402 RepID=A0ABR5FGT8_9MYCO|nr:MerR family transcriptional regulator [Mycolicibacter heraklionensis]
MVDEMDGRSGLGVYGISVAAELSGVGPQTLRLYESRGLLTPARTAGGTRRYSDDDLARLRRITELVDIGINVAGIGQILGLEARNARLESDNSKLQSDNTRLRSDNTQLKSDYALLAAQRADRAASGAPRARKRKGS